MERYIVTEVRIFVKFFASAVARAVAILITSKNVNDAMHDLIGDVGEVHLVT